MLICGTFFSPVTPQNGDSYMDFVRHTMCCAGFCLCVINGYAVQTELSISSETIAQNLAREVGKVDRSNGKVEELQSPHGASNMPDLAKVNSSSETHIGGINELEQKIDDFEHQLRDMLHSLTVIKKRMQVIQHIVDERFADCQRQMASLKDQTRHELQPMPLVITSTCSHDVLVGTT
jgi:hypothetical protein